MADTPEKSEDALLKDIAARLRQKNITKSLTSDLDETAGILKSQKGRLAELHELANRIKKDSTSSVKVVDAAEKNLKDEKKRLEQLQKDLEANDKFKQGINAQVAKSRTRTEQANAKSDDLSQKTATLSAAGKNLNIDNGGALDKIVQALAAGMAKAVTDMRALGLPAKEFAAKTLAVLDKYKDGIATDPALNLKGDKNAAKAKAEILDILGQHMASVVTAGELSPTKLLGNALKGGLKQGIANTVKGLPGMATMDKLASVMGLKPVSERINEKLGGKKGSLDQKLTKERGAGVANVQDGATDTIASALGTRTGQDIANDSLATAKPIGDSPVSVRSGRGMSAGSAGSFMEDTAGNLGSNGALGYLKNIEDVLHELWQLGDDAAKRDIEAAQDANEARAEKNTDAAAVAGKDLDTSPIPSSTADISEGEPEKKEGGSILSKIFIAKRVFATISTVISSIGALVVPIGLVSGALIALGGILGGAAFLGFFKTVGGGASSSKKTYKDAAKINKDAGKEVISSVGGSNAMAPRIKAYEEKIKAGGTKEEAAMAAAAVDKAPAPPKSAEQVTEETAQKIEQNEKDRIKAMPEGTEPEKAAKAAATKKVDDSFNARMATKKAAAPTPVRLGGGGGGGAAQASGLKVKDSEGSGQATAGGPVAPGVIDFASQIQGNIPGFTRFTGFNDNYHQGLSKPSKHKAGLAMDFTIADSSKSGQAVSAVQSLAQKAGAKVFVQDEYKNPSGKSTGGHIHVQFPDEGESAKFLGNDPSTESPTQVPGAAPRFAGGPPTGGAAGTGSPTAPTLTPGAPASTRSAPGVAAGTAGLASAGAASPMIVANIGGPSAPAPSVTMMMPIPMPIRPRTEDMVLRAIQSVNYV